MSFTSWTHKLEGKSHTVPCFQYCFTRKHWLTPAHSVRNSSEGKQCRRVLWKAGLWNSPMHLPEGCCRRFGTFTARRLFRIGPPQIDLLLLDRKIEHILLYLFSWICNFYHCSFFFPSLCSFLGSKSQSCYPHAASSGRLTARREDDLSLTASAWSTVVWSKHAP